MHTGKKEICEIPNLKIAMFIYLPNLLSASGGAFLLLANAPAQIFYIHPSS